MFVAYMRKIRLLNIIYSACKKDIHDNCQTGPGQKQSKPDIVHCLSLNIRDSVLSGKPAVISDDCRKEVNFELLAEFEHIKLNPQLAKHCDSDIKKYCVNIKEGREIEVNF